MQEEKEKRKHQRKNYTIEKRKVPMNNIQGKSILPKTIY